MVGRTAGLIAAALVLTTGCSYNKETVPLARSWAPVRAANQQRLVALAVDDAVDQLDFGKLAGKNVVVEIAGVFPHSDPALLDYILMQVEGKASRAGAHVAQIAPIGNYGLTDIRESPKAENADFRVLVGVSWAGIDTREKVVTDEERLAGQVGLATGGFLAGFAMQNFGESGIRYVVPGGAGTVSTGLMIGAPAVALIWALIKPPVLKTLTLIGRCRLEVDVDPVQQGGAYLADGEGTSRIVVDENSPTGFRLTGNGRVEETMTQGINQGVNTVNNAANAASVIRNLAQ